MDRTTRITGAAILLLITLVMYGVQRGGTDTAAPVMRPAVRPTPALPRPSDSFPDTPLTAPPGFTVRVYASALGHPRTIVFSPGGTMLVSDPDAGTVTALPDADRSGRADGARTVISGGGARPHGLAFLRGYLFVARETGVDRYVWNETALSAAFDRTIMTLPPNRNHNNRSIVADGNGTLYVSVGSTCNVCRETDGMSGTVMVTDTDGRTPSRFATGLRNAAFLALNPDDGTPWVTEMGRDYLGDSLPPDEINVLTRGSNYGWPDCYGDNTPDTAFPGADPAVCPTRTPPVYGIRAHAAPLGIAFIPGTGPMAKWRGDLVVAYHGSWNSSVPVGYRVVRLHRTGTLVSGESDILTGFLTGGSVAGRPAGVAFDTGGILYVTDDRAGMVYSVSGL